MSDFEEREDAESRSPSDALQDSLEELSRLADSLVDGLADEIPDDPPQEAAPRTENASGESMHRALVDLDELDEIDSPRKQVELELEGDRGDDIDAHLDALFGDGGGMAEPAAEPEPDDDLGAIDLVEPVEATSPIELSDSTDMADAVDEAEPEPIPDPPADEIRVDFYDAQLNKPAVRDEIEAEAEEAIESVQASARTETEVTTAPEVVAGSSRTAIWVVAAVLLLGITAGVWAFLSGALDGLIGKTATTASTGRADVDRLARPAQTESLKPLPVVAEPESVDPEPVVEPIQLPPKNDVPVETEPTIVPKAPVEPVAPAPAEVQIASIVPEPDVPEAELPSEIAVEVPRIVQPIPLNRIEPVYSARARTRGESGTVVLNILVNERGRVVRVVVDQGIPGSDLEAAAIDAVLRWNFRPGKEDGRPVRAWITERFVFEP